MDRSNNEAHRYLAQFHRDAATPRTSTPMRAQLLGLATRSSTDSVASVNSSKSQASVVNSTKRSSS